MPRLVGWLVQTISLLVIWGFFGSVCYRAYLSRHSPHVPDTASAQIVPLYTGAWVYYVRPQEAFLADKAWIFLFAILLLVALVVRIKYGASGPAKESDSPAQSLLARALFFVPWTITMVYVLFWR